jgi:hypothetical protein
MGPSTPAAVHAAECSARTALCSLAMSASCSSDTSWPWPLPLAAIWRQRRRRGGVGRGSCGRVGSGLRGRRHGGWRQHGWGWHGWRRRSGRGGWKAGRRQAPRRADGQIHERAGDGNERLHVPPQRALLGEQDVRHHDERHHAQHDELCAVHEDLGVVRHGGGLAMQVGFQLRQAGLELGQAGAQLGGQFRHNRRRRWGRLHGRSRGRLGHEQTDCHVQGGSECVSGISAATPTASLPPRQHSRPQHAWTARANVPLL